MGFWVFRNVVCDTYAIERAYVASRVSSAYCFTWLCTVLLVVVPFVVAYASGQLWLKEATYREQPVVSFAHNVIIFIDGSLRMHTCTRGAQKMWSTIPELNTHYARSLTVPTIRYRPHDDNNDDIADEITITLSMPLGSLTTQAPSTATSVFVALEFLYRLSGTCRLFMRSLAVVQATTPLRGASRADFKGLLLLRQHGPLLSGPKARRVYEGSPFTMNVNSNSAAPNAPFSLRHMFAEYSNRNETTYVEFDVPPLFGFEPSESFDISLSLRIPNQVIYYIPGTTSVLYHAWLQYISALIPTWLVLRCVKKFVFSNQIFPSFVVDMQKDD